MLLRECCWHLRSSLLDQTQHQVISRIHSAWLSRSSLFEKRRGGLQIWRPLSSLQIGLCKHRGNMVGLGFHFSRDDFQCFLLIFEFIRLPSKLAMSLVVPSLSLMCIFCLPSGLRAGNLLSYQLVGLEACLSWDFLRSGWLPNSRSSLDVAKNGQTNLIPISRRVPVLNLEFAHCLGFSLLWKIFQKTAVELVDFSVDFCSGFLVAKHTKNAPNKNRRKIRQPKTENPPAHESPEIRQPGPNIRRKTYQQICLSNLQVHAGFLRLRRFALWRRASSDHGFWDTLWVPSGHGRGSHVEMHLQSVSCCWWGRDKVCCAPFQTTLLVKSVRFEKTAQK